MRNQEVTRDQFDLAPPHPSYPPQERVQFWPRVILFDSCDLMPDSNIFNRTTQQCNFMEKRFRPSIFAISPKEEYQPEYGSSAFSASFLDTDKIINRN